MKDSHYPTVRPAADIMDADGGGVQIVANMPGVRAEDLCLALDGRELRIRASSHCPRPEAGSRDLLNLEFGNVEYELDIAMEAPLSAPPVITMERGVLSVCLPPESRGKVHFV